MWNGRAWADKKNELQSAAAGPLTSARLPKLDRYREGEREREEKRSKEAREEKLTEPTSVTWQGDYFRLGQPFLGDGSKVCGLLGGLLRPPAVASVTLGVQAWTWSRLDTHPVVKGWACAWVSGRPDTEINRRPPGSLCLQNLPQDWQGLGLSWLSVCLVNNCIIVVFF